MLSIFLGNSKLLFSKVPSTVYPTTQSILQQEDNEVIDSLSPAYKELPSTHFSYVSCFNGNITSDPSYCGNNQSTILPNSTKTSIRPHTNSLSSEQLNIQRLSNDSTIFQRNTSKAESINNGSTTTDVASTDTETIVSPLPIKPEQSNDSSLSIHITTVPNNLQRCPTSSTRGIIIEKDLKIQTESNENSRHDIEPENDGPNEPTMNNGHTSNVPTINDGQLNETLTNEQQLNDPVMNDPVMNDQRLCTQICELNKNSATTSGKNTNSNAIRCESSRGASSFGGIELSPKTRAFSPDYYALTFRREGSSLSDVSCSSLRGASAFGGSSTTNCGSFAQEKLPITGSASHAHERGASVFGQTLHEGLYLENHPMIKHETEKQSIQFINHETSVVNCRKSELETGRSSTVKEIRPELENNTYKSRINTKAAKMSPSHGSNHSTAEIIVSAIESVAGNSTKLQRKNQSSTKMIKIPSYGNISVLSNINKRSNSQTSTKSCKANVEKDKRATGIKSGFVSGQEKDNSEKSVTLQIYKKPIILPKNNTSNSPQQVTLDKPITTVQSSPRDDKAPMTIVQNVQRDRNRAMKTLDAKSNSKTSHLNNTYLSLRGASQLGHLGDDDDDVCSDNDALWDSISLSFAYESASEDDSMSQLQFKEN